MNWNKLIDNSLGGGEAKKKIFYERSSRIPLGTKEKWSEYEGLSTMSKSDWVYYDIEPNERFHWSLLAPQGSYKTTFLKRTMPYFYYHGYNLMCVDPKSADLRDSLIAIRDVGKGSRLHPDEFPISIPAKSCIPSFAATQKMDVRSVPLRTVNKMDFKFTFGVNDFKTLDEWKTLLGTTDSGASVMCEFVRKYKSFGKLVDAVKRSPPSKVHSSTRVSLLNKLERAFNMEVFDMPYFHKLDVSDFWKERVVPIIMFFRRDPSWQSATVYKLLADQYVFGERFGINHKLNYFDDCQYYFGNDNVATEIFKDTIDHGRAHKFNSILAFQNPNNVARDILESCSDKFFAANDTAIDTIRNVWNSQIAEEVRNLDYDDSRKPVKHVQYLWVPKNFRKRKTFYVAGSIVGHPF